jgi:predicted transcriptional regulator
VQQAEVCNCIAMRKTTSFQTFNENAIEQVAARFRALGEASRLKLIFAAGKGEKNVTQLIAATGLSQANVSKHLHILTDNGILNCLTKSENTLCLRIPLKSPS